MKSQKEALEKARSEGRQWALDFLAGVDLLPWGGRWIPVSPNVDPVAMDRAYSNGRAEILRTLSIWKSRKQKT